MAQVSAPTGADMYWIADQKAQDVCWSPGAKVEDRENTIVVKCLVTGEAVELKRSEAVLVHPSCLGKIIT